MAKTLELQFGTDLGRIVRLTVDNPIEPVDPAAVKVAMEAIISSNAFFSNYGNLASVGGARVVERNVTEYEIV
jgi:spore coat polysaccharide biosynthesis protein SpsF (cytidylyltransferase family)